MSNMAKMTPYSPTEENQDSIPVVQAQAVHPSNGDLESPGHTDRDVHALQPGTNYQREGQIVPVSAQLVAPPPSAPKGARPLAQAQRNNDNECNCCSIVCGSVAATAALICCCCCILPLIFVLIFVMGNPEVLEDESSPWGG